MTIQEYVDPIRFPVTTQKGLAPQRQLMIDAFNHDQLREFLEEGGQPSEEQRHIWAELQEKMKDHAALTAELAKESETRRTFGE